MLTRALVYFAYYLKTSPRYQRGKQFFRNLLDNPDSRLKSYFDVLMIALVITSVFLLISEAEGKVGAVEWYEHAIVSLFIAEYVLRLWICSDNHKLIIEHYERAQYLGIPFQGFKVIAGMAGKKLKYIISPLALIDLLAILPSYRELRVLRVFLVFRLFKLFRYLSSIKLFAEILSTKRFELYTLGIFLSFLIFIGSTGLYLFENPGSGGQVHNLFEALYLSVVTLATVGYGDISPHTTGGRLIAMALIFSGLGFISFFTSIIVSAFSDKMQDMRASQVYLELKRREHVIIICGFGRVGQHIAGHLQNSRQAFVVIDPDETKINKAKHLRYPAILDDASKNSVLINAGINTNASAVVCTAGDDVTNVYITLTSRHLNPQIRILSRANSRESVQKLYQAGANDVIQPFEIAGMVIAEYLGQPVAFEAIFGILSEKKQFVMETVPVYENCFLAGQTIAALNFDQRKLMLAGVISNHPAHDRHDNRYPVKNQCFYFNPAAHFELQVGDLLVVLGRKLSIDYFRDLIEKSRLQRGHHL
ncbi:MAG: potassium channel protein [Methylobacter sp.]|nr:MAG: potassium channel protein [Methylobacter sp.]